MKQLAMLIFVVMGGMALALEAAILGPLGERIGKLSASLSIFLIGILVFSIAMVIQRRSYILKLAKLPPWLLSGGLVGFAYTLVLVVATPLVGVGATMVGILCGQITASLAIDHFGILGTKKRKVDSYRIIALGLILAALWLIY